MTRRVDAADERQAEVPDEVGVDERRDEAARGSVDVDGDVLCCGKSSSVACRASRK